MSACVAPQVMELSEQLEEHRALAVEKSEELAQVDAQLAVTQQAHDDQRAATDRLQEENSQLQVGRLQPSH